MGTRSSPVTVPANQYSHVSITGRSQAHLGNVVNITNSVFIYGSPTDQRVSLLLPQAKTCRPQITMTTKTERKAYWLFLWWIVLNVDAHQINTLYGAETTYSLMLRLLGQWMATWTFHAYCDRSLRIFRPEMRRVRPVSHAFFKACLIGDVFEMKRMITTSEASLHDVTEDNLDAMYFAIEGGNLHSVQTLIDLSADVNQVFGINSTSPLCWALQKREKNIVELLIRKNACQQHISKLGCAPFFYLWPSTTTHLPSSFDLLKQLRTADIFSFEDHVQYLKDINGWDALNRIAAHGEPEELDLIFESDVDIDTLVGPLEWPATFNAVYYGNLENLKKIRAHFQDTCIDRCDKRGWTMLHIAIDEGHEDIIRYLIGEGASLQIQSIPVYTDEHIDPRFLELSVTPIDVARGHGAERVQMLNRALQEARGVSLDEVQTAIDVENEKVL